MESSMCIPIILWSHSKPVFRISTLCVTPDFKKLITGSHNGQLCLWDLHLNKNKISPMNILIGHKDSVTCMASTNEYVISSCEGKLMCRWNLDDGYCSKMKSSLFVHRKMLFYENDKNEKFLFSCGDYSEIFIIQPFTLQVVYIFHTKSINMWISSFQIIKRQDSRFVSSITVNGCVKFWMFDDLLSDIPNETQSYILPITDVLDYKYNSDLSVILIVAINCWMLYNSEMQFSNYTCKVEACKEERLLGGNFCENDVIIWTNSGKFYFYKISENKEKQICVFLDDYSTITVFTPASSLIQFDAEKYLIRGDSQGRISIWKIDLPKEECYPTFSVELADKWVTNENDFFNSFVHYSIITCCICAFEIDKFFIGCLNGSIISIPAIESLIWFYFKNDLEKPLIDILIGHNGKINCLLYPYEKYSYYNKSHLVSGGSDFSVCLWDIFKNELLFKFCVQSGEILRLIVPPENSYMPLKLSICSISSDHSVAILNLKNRRCLILTSRHEFPVVMVHWRPLDDFIIIECLDGTIYVWQIETGHLDRVLDGVMAQEVIYACSEAESNSPALNFYIQESNVKKNLMKQKLYNVCENSNFSPFKFNRFLTNEISESHILLCDLETIFAQFNCNFESEPLDCAINSNMYLLTKALNSELQKKASASPNNILRENEISQNKLEYSRSNSIKPCFKDSSTTQNDLNCPLLSESVIKFIQFFLSSVHFWGLNSSLDEIFISKLSLLKPKKSICFGIQSQPGIYSLFLPSAQNSRLQSSSLFPSLCVAVLALAKIMLSYKTLDQELIESKKTWKNLISFYELTSVDLREEIAIPKPNIKILTEAWQTRSLHLRSIIRKLLRNYLQAADGREIAKLLEIWSKYLPHFKTVDKTMPENEDFENIDLKTIALVLFGIVGSDFKFKSIESSCQDNYVYQTCASFVYLVLLPPSQMVHFSTLQRIAIDFIGRGYILWEQLLNIEKIIPILFKKCANLSRKSFSFNKDATEDSSIGIAASNALKSIAIARTAAFIKCLTNEITKIKLGQDSNFLTDDFKAELLSILTFLLEKTPYIMLLYLNDVISLLIHCIDISHLRHENLENLIPVLRKFRQVHHSMTSQKIAVGLATGSLVLHDLKTGKVHEISAHKDSISALKFSEDGKFLVSYSCYENRISFWQVLTGIFGLGHVQIKCAKSCQTYQIHDEEIRNHLEIASLTWTDKRSVVLSLCDGSKDIFHF